MTRSSPLIMKTIPTLDALKAQYPGLKALFFDMDGTIFNTESHHAQAFWKIGLDHKIRPTLPPDAIHALLMGKADYLVFDIVKDWEGFPPHWSVEEFISIKNQNLLDILSHIEPGTYFAKEIGILLQQAKLDNFYLALVTSSEKIITERLLKLAGLDNFFHLEITRDDCPAHKPDPWPYLQALNTSGYRAHETLIFEDSHVGLTSALGSGAHVIKVEWY